jgi:hypothetical protein
MITAVKALLLLVGSGGLAFLTVYFFRDRQRAGEVMINWWVEESHTASGRRKLSSGTWGSKKWDDPEVRRQAAAMQGWIFPIMFGMASLMLLLAGVSVLVRA